MKINIFYTVIYGESVYYPKPEQAATATQYSTAHTRFGFLRKKKENIR